MDKRTFLTWCLAALLLYGYAIPPVYSAIQGVMGIAVDAGGQDFNSVKDAVNNENLTGGIVPFAPYTFNGTSYDRSDAGNEFYAIKHTAVAGTSINFDFGFPSKKVAIETLGSNSNDVCIDWLGGTAVCPASNTAGDDMLSAGLVILLEPYVINSVSIKSATGTNQTVYVRAWR